MKNTLLILLAALGSFAANSQADLRVVEIESPDWDDSTVIVFEIKNYGNEDAENFKVKAWDVDATWKDAKSEMGATKDDRWIFDENVGRSEEGQTDYDTDWEVVVEIEKLKAKKSMKITISVEHWIYDSNCEFGVFVDSENTVKEKDEKNNKSYFFAGG